MKHTDRKSRLFFIEFLIVLFFFLIVSTVCLRLFAYARQITDRADALSHAQAAAASAAELLSATDGAAESLAAYYPDAVVEENSLTLMYDRTFRSCSQQEACYTMTIDLSAEVSSQNLPPTDESIQSRSFSDETESSASDSSETDRSGTKMIDPVTEKNAVIHVSDDDGKELYSLSVSLHTPLTRGEVLK